MDILNQIKKIVLLEVSDEIKSVQLHKLFSNLSADWTIKFCKKDKILDYRIQLKNNLLEGKLNLI